MKRLSTFLLGALLALTFSVSAQQQTINIGSTANDGTGDTLRSAGAKMNSNFTELYNSVTAIADRFTGGVLEVAHGGTNLAAAADDNTIVGNGTTWQTKTIPTCSAGTSALTYNISTNAFGCNTISSGASLTATQVGFGDGSNVLSGEADLIYNSSTNNLHIGSLATAGAYQGPVPPSTTADGIIVRLRGGAGGSTSGAGGAAQVIGGSPVVGAGGDVFLTGSNGQTTGAGGNVYIGAGSSATGAGAVVQITAGNAASTSAGGAITITAGAGGGSSGAGGAITLTTGTAAGSGSSGALNLRTGDDGGDGVGNILIQPGSLSSGNVQGGAVNVLGSNGFGAGAGGAVLIRAGAGGSSGNGALLTLEGGQTTAGTAGSILLRTNNADRMTLEPDGSWNFGGSNGTSGQVLTSTGSTTAPTWQTAAVTVTTGEFTANWTQACSTTPTNTWNYTLVGAIVTLSPESGSGGNIADCTSDSTFFITSTGDMPVAIRPNVQTALLGMVPATNNGGAVAACVRIQPDGSIELLNSTTSNLCSTSSNSWTNSGTKGAANLGQGYQFTYQLDNN